MRFRPYDQATVPNIVVDGSPRDNTLLTLSHWPKSGTPFELKADTSAEIAFKYLESPRFHVESEIVTNNHFDQDGLVGVFALIEPPAATRHRDLLIDIASAGDFGVSNREKRRVSILRCPRFRIRRHRRFRSRSSRSPIQRWPPSCTFACLRCFPKSLRTRTISHRYGSRG